MCNAPKVCDVRMRHLLLQGIHGMRHSWSSHPYLACDTSVFVQDGIIKSEMSSSLQHGTHGDCGAWFASNDGLYRMIFSSGRPSAIAEWYTRSCYNSKAISATRKELRELKKSTNKHWKATSRGWLGYIDSHLFLSSKSHFNTTIQRLDKWNIVLC